MANAPNGEPADWRTHLQPESRQRIVNRIIDMLRRHCPSGDDELRNIAVAFEEKVYSAANSQSDYLRIIALKMHTVETSSQNTLIRAIAAILLNQL